MVPSLDPEFIADLYSAAAEPDALNRMSLLIQKALNVDSAGLWLGDGTQIEAMALTEDLVESARPYLAYYAAIDPWSKAKLAHGSRVTIGHELVPETELVRTEFYNDFARHFDLFRPMGALIEVAPGRMVSLSICRKAPGAYLDDRDRPAVEEVAVHLRRALGIWLKFREAPSAWSVDALDRLSFGVAVCQASGRVVFANAWLRRMTDERHGITLKGRPPRIGAKLPGESEALGALVFQAATRQGAVGAGLRLTGSGGRRLTVTVTPLPPSDGFGLGKAMVAVQAEEAVPSPGIGALRTIYGLSPAQAELCMGLAAGHTFEALSKRRGVAVSTLRSHFSVVLARTGSRNLRDLIRLLGAVSLTGNTEGSPG